MLIVSSYGRKLHNFVMFPAVSNIVPFWNIKCYCGSNDNCPSFTLFLLV